MLRSCLCRRTILLVKSSDVVKWVTPPSPSPFLLQHPNPFRLLLLNFLYTTQNQDPHVGHSFTVSYLINSCGLSPDSALSASKRVQFDSAAQPDSVIQLFKIHGFSQDQISAMIRKSPPLLAARPTETLLPKLNYLYSIGFSHSDTAHIFAMCPWIFNRSLKNHLIPAYHFFLDLVQTNERVVATFMRKPQILNTVLHAYFEPNITTLRVAKVPVTGISYLVRWQPTVLFTNPCTFRVIVEKVKGLGISPSKLIFVKAVVAFRSLSKESWDRKIDVFRSWGWSEDMTKEAFKRSPLCINLSEDRIMAAMDYFVNKFGLDSSYIARAPQVLLFSLKTRTLPRCSIVQVLQLKSLMKRSYHLSTILGCTEQSFLDKFVTPYLEEAPELLDLYKEKRAIAKEATLDVG